MHRLCMSTDSVEPGDGLLIGSGAAGQVPCKAAEQGSADAESNAAAARVACIPVSPPRVHGARGWDLLEAVCLAS